jgi:Tetratricopeptide repeat
MNAVGKSQARQVSFESEDNMNRMNRTARIAIRPLLVLAGLTFMAYLPGIPASADTLTVTIGTTPLSGTSASLALDFIDGDGIVNNSVTISNFQSDANLGTPITTGDVSGTLPGPVILSDTQFFNELLVPLTLATSISFNLDYTNTAGSPPDSFSLFLLDPSAVNSLVTTDLPGDALLQIQMDGTNTNVSLAGNIAPAVGISTNSVVTTPTPEPPSGALLSIGCLCIAILSSACVRRRRRWVGWLTLLIVVLPSTASAQSLATLDSDLHISLSGIVLNRATNTFDTRATMTNVSTTNLSGPFSFVVTAITPSNVFLADATCVTPTEQPVIVSAFPPGGLLPGQSLVPLLLQFSDPLQKGFNFTQTVLAGDLCATEDTLRDFSDAHILPDDATLLQAMQTLSPLYCQLSATVNPMTLAQAMASLRQNLDQLAGSGALESFLTSSSQTDQEILVAQAAAATASSRGPGALAALLAAHQNDPQNPMHLVNAAGAAANLGMFNEALALLDAADAMGGDFGSPMGINGHAVALNNRGFALAQLGQWSQAQTVLRSAISMEPLLAEARTNLGIALFCQGDTSNGEKYFRAGIRRSPNDLTVDQTFDLEGGLAPNLAEVPYPAIADQLKAYHDFYLTYLANLSDKENSLLQQSDSYGQQELQQELQNPLPPVTALRIVDIANAFGRIKSMQFDDQTPPELPPLWSNVLAKQQAAQALYNEINNQFGAWRAAEPLPCCDKFGHQTSAHLAWLAQGRSQVRGLLTQFLYTQGKYDQATRAFLDPWYKALTGLAANISEPLEEQSASLSAQENLLFQYSVIVLYAYNDVNPLTAWWEEAQAPNEPATLDPTAPGQNGPQPCPDVLQRLGASVSFFDVFSFKLSCDKLTFEGSLPGLGPFASVSETRKGDWSVFVGVKGTLGPITQKEGIYLKGDDQGLTDGGMKISTSLKAGPISYESPTGMEASFVDAYHYYFH